MSNSITKLKNAVILFVTAANVIFAAKPMREVKHDSIHIVSISAPQTNQINIPDSLSICMKGGKVKDVNWEIIVAAAISVIGVGATVYGNKTRERNNIIRQARIAWIQELRKNLSLLPTEAEVISLKFGILLKTGLDSAQNKPEEIDKLIVEFIRSNIETLAKIEGFCHLVVLHLNPRRDADNYNEHLKLETLVKKLASSISYDGLYKERVDLTALCSEIIEESRIVIKSAWEDAKN